ncbi:MAG: glycosyltransferase family 4 protein [Gemmatimonadota bacterium]
MKVLFVSDYGTPSGGAELELLRLRDGLRERGHEARLLASSARPGREPSRADAECFGTLSGWRTPLQTANPWARRRLRQELETFRPDVVHVGLFLTQLSPLILPLLARVPSLYHVMWYRPVCPLGTKLLPDGSICRVPWGRPCLENGCLPFPDWTLLMLQMRRWRRWRRVFRQIVAVSEAVRLRLEAEGIEPVTVIAAGWEPNPPGPPLDRDPLIVFAGRLVPEKGTHILVSAFAAIAGRHPTARLRIAGDGPDRGRLERLVAAHGLRDQVTFLGHLDRAGVERAFAGAWAQAVPSIWEEPYGLVAAEAMMRGTAVLASRIGGLGPLVQDGETGLHVPAGDARALASVLDRVVGDRAFAERLGAAGRSAAALRARVDPVEQFLELYVALLGESARPALHCVPRTRS